MNTLKELFESTEINQELIKARYSDADWMKHMDKASVSVTGLGNIGSWLALFLGRLGCKMYLRDYDTVEPHNIGAQLYGIHDVGESKAKVTRNALVRLGVDTDKIVATNALQVRMVSDLFRRPEQLHFNKVKNNHYDAVFLCVDNMTTRKRLFSDVRGNNCLFVDGRSSPEHYQVFSFMGTDKDAASWYEEKYLFSDESVPDAPCSFKSTTYCGSQVASTMAAHFVNFIANEVYGASIRPIPFKVEVNLAHGEYNISDYEQDISHV